MQPSLLWIATVFFKITLNHYKTPCIVSFWQLPDDCFSWSNWNSEQQVNVFDLVLDFSGNMSQIYEFYWFISKQTREPFVFIKRCDWTIFFHVSWLDSLHCNITIKKTKLPELSWYDFYEYSHSKSLSATTKKWYNFENKMNSILESMWLLLTWFYYKEQKIMLVVKYFFSNVFSMFLHHR